MLAQNIFAQKFLENAHNEKKSFAVIEREILLVYHLLKSQFYYLFYYNFLDHLYEKILPTPEFTEYRAKRETFL